MQRNVNRSFYFFASIAVGFSRRFAALKLFSALAELGLKPRTLLNEPKRLSEKSLKGTDLIASGASRRNVTEKGSASLKGTNDGLSRLFSISSVPFRDDKLYSHESPGFTRRYFLCGFQPLEVTLQTPSSASGGVPSQLKWDKRWDRLNTRKRSPITRFVPRPAELHNTIVSVPGALPTWFQTS